MVLVLYMILNDSFLFKIESLIADKDFQIKRLEGLIEKLEKNKTSFILNEINGK